MYKLEWAVEDLKSPVNVLTGSLDECTTLYLSLRQESDTGFVQVKDPEGNLLMRYSTITKSSGVGSIETSK